MASEGDDELSEASGRGYHKRKSMVVHMNKDNQRKAKIFISGRVQGVFFRRDTKEKALQLGLSGWVRNEQDGRVCIEIEGEKRQLDEFLSWVKKGPRFAQVENIEIEWGKPENNSGFEIKY